MSRYQDPESSTRHPALSSISDEDGFAQPLSDLVPMVIQRSGNTERAMDLFSLLLEKGIVDITGGINDSTAKLVTAQLQYLASKKNELKNGIRLYLNSPGGSVSAGLAIYDCIQSLDVPVSIICRGIAASMGAVLLAGGSKGRRGISCHSKVMIHQPLIGGMDRTKSTDLEIQTNELVKTRVTLGAIIAKHCGKSTETVIADMKDDLWLTAEEALAYGIVDEIIGDTEKV
jgi:ATP-dependent Clp protease, protease subunit